MKAQKQFKSNFGPDGDSLFITIRPHCHFTIRRDQLNELIEIL